MRNDVKEVLISTMPVLLIALVAFIVQPSAEYFACSTYLAIGLGFLIQMRFDEIQHKKSMKRIADSWEQLKNG